MTRKRIACGIRSRRGSAYVLVLTLSVVVTVVAATAIQASRMGVRAGVAQREAAEAASVAQSGLDHILQLIATTPTWRATYGAIDASPKVLRDGTQYKWQLTDETDGDLLDDPDDPVRVSCTATVGGASRTVSVELAKYQGKPLDVLGMGFYTTQGVTSLTDKRAFISPDTPLGAAGLFNNRVDIIGDIECGAYAGDGTVSGTVSMLSTPKAMPPASVFDFYQVMATPIPWATHAGTFEPLLLSAAVNPYGPLNADGVYYVSVPAFEDLKLKDTRIAGTLVIDLGVGASVQFKDLVWEPHRNDLPMAVIRSGGLGCEVAFQGAGGGSLSESSLGVNLNPGHTPFNGQSDSTLDDSYTCQFVGLMHVIGSVGTVELRGGVNIRGCVLSDCPIELTQGLSDLDWRISQNPSLLLQPPQGYTTGSGGDFMVTEGSLRWDVQP